MSYLGHSGGSLVVRDSRVVFGALGRGCAGGTGTGVTAAAVTPRPVRAQTMHQDPPLVAVATMTSWGAVYGRIARWLGTGFEEIGVRADVVCLGLADPHVPAADPHNRCPEPTSVRQVELGLRRARWALPRLAKYLNEVQPSMTLATPGTVGSVAVIAGEMTGHAAVPWVSTVPRMDEADIPRYLRTHRYVSDRLHARAPTVAAVSNGVRDAIAADLARFMNPAEIVVIPNPVDADEVRRLGCPTAMRNGRLRLCSVGRLVSAKGFDVLIDALALSSLGKSWELLIIGEGPLRGALERKVDQLKLDEQIRFLGWLENPYPVLATADIAVQASRWEGFGVAMLEALALGVPQIGTDCPGGVAEVLDNGKYGVLVPPEDPVALAEAIESLAGDASLRSSLAERGPERAAHFSPARVAAQVADLAVRVSSKEYDRN